MGPIVRYWPVLVSLGALCAPGAVPFLYTETPRFDPTAPQRFPQGARIQVVQDGQSSAVVPGFAASADPAVSFDGHRVLFSGKQTPDSPWQIWETAWPAGTPRRLTATPDDAVTPFYLSANQIVYSRRTPTGFQVESLVLGATDPHRLTFAPGDHLVTAVLRDGRILMDATHPGPPPVRDLYTVHADGTGYESYRCDHGPDRHSGAEVASGDIVFETAGRLARFTSARAVQVDLPAIAGEFASRIAELSAAEWLVAFRPDARQPFGIWRWTPGKGSPEKVRSTAGVDAVEPVVLQPHEVPKRHPSAVGNREGANLLCLNAYTSRSAIPQGSIASVRVWTLDDRGAAVPLGNSPVETDGSFFVQTPSDRALRFELLDRAGKTVAAEKGWFWARRGEQRVCVGCHAGPERAPENAVPATLRRSIEPARLRFPSGGQ